MNGWRPRLGRESLHIVASRTARRPALVWAAASGCILWSAVAAHRTEATTIVAKDFTALCAEADLVFVGTVTDVRSQWVDPDRNSIETLVTFGQLTPLLGVDGDQLTLRFSGGSVDGIREEFVGAPRFAAGERVVVFAHAGRWISPIVGFNQGCVHVVDGADGPVVLEADAQRLGYGEAGSGTAASGAAGALPLSEFLQRVRRELGTRSKP